MFKNVVFSKSDFSGQAKGGIFFRSFDLSKFLEKIEANDEEVVGWQSRDDINKLMVDHG